MAFHRNCAHYSYEYVYSKDLFAYVQNGEDRKRNRKTSRYIWISVFPLVVYFK